MGLRDHSQPLAAARPIGRPLGGPWGGLAADLYSMWEHRSMTNRDKMKAARHATQRAWDQVVVTHKGRKSAEWRAYERACKEEDATYTALVAEEHVESGTMLT